MSRTIDIRNEKREEPITKIRVANPNSTLCIAEIIENIDCNSFNIKDSDGFDSCVEVIGKQHAENLIAGLQKAIQLGWVE